MGGLSETGPIHAKEMKNPDDGLWIEMRMLCVWDLLAILQYAQCSIHSKAHAFI